MILAFIAVKKDPPPENRGEMLAGPTFSAVAALVRAQRVAPHLTASEIEVVPVHLPESSAAVAALFQLPLWSAKQLLEFLRDMSSPLPTPAEAARLMERALQGVPPAELEPTEIWGQAQVRAKAEEVAEALLKMDSLKIRLLQAQLLMGGQ